MSQENIYSNIQTATAVRDPVAVSKKSATIRAPLTGVPSEHSGAGLKLRKAGKPLLSPEQLHLQKQLNQPSRSR